ncbi:hypothetical protein ACHAWF_005363 [Thalassiosira exigua]
MKDLRAWISIAATSCTLMDNAAADVDNGSFQGNLPYNLYSNAPANGDGCIESNSVGTGSILSLVPMDEPNTFCERDVLDSPPPGWPANEAIYTKIELSRMSDTSDDVGIKFFDCEG